MVIRLRRLPHVNGGDVSHGYIVRNGQRLQGYRLCITTMRLELVPRSLLSTPQIFAVLVKVCWLITTQTGSHAVSCATSATTRSSNSDPRRISPTSKANTPPGRVIDATLCNAPRTSAESKNARFDDLP